ncbi:uncharacterized protein [Primulina huaijiensis]|uniref:uncharacterized protein isoform X2 n=1 Tax=Primulina huaijiensis TaxID=1492673 RepID=UPI003CC77C28
MYAIKDGWVRQSCSIAPSSDLEVRKSRIRRSKEERKSLAESFIKKYQKSNNGSFPSLNITHKEVGGSFYTVREIVREIIQENKVLTSPKMNLEEHDHYQFLVNGYMATEHQNDSLVSDRTHLVMNKSPYQYGIKSEENFSSYSIQSYGPESLDLKIINGLSEMRNKEEGYDTDNHLLLDHSQGANAEETSNLGEQLPPSDTHAFETEIFVSGGEVFEENPVSDKAISTKAVHIHDQDKSEVNFLTPVQNFDGAETERFNGEKYFNKNNQTVEKTKEFGQRICTESVVMETLGRKKTGAEDIEVLCAMTSHVNFDVTVENFPLRRPLFGRIHDISADSDTFLEERNLAGILKEKTRQHDKLIIIGCPSGVNESDENKLPDSTLELDDELRNEKMVTSATKHLVSEESLGTERNSSDYVTSSVSEGSRPLLQRISLETWKRESKKSSVHKSGSLLESVKSYLVAFVKFWSE